MLNCILNNLDGFNFPYHFYNSDVNFGIIGYGPENEQPSIRTTNGKLTVDKNTKIVFSNTPPKIPRSSLGQNVKNIKYFLGIKPFLK